MKKEKYKILIVEDDKVLSEELKCLLIAEGLIVAEAQNGKEALEILRYGYIDLILSDIVMPEKNGYELFKEVKLSNELSNIPFIFLSEKSTYEEFRIGMENGADDYIAKPFYTSDLIKAIKMRLKKKENILKNK